MASPTPPPLDDGAVDAPLPKTPPPSWSMPCGACDKVIAAPSEAVLLKQLDFHAIVCTALTNRTLKPDDEDKFMFTKLVHEHELNKMEVKIKCGEMSRSTGGGFLKDGRSGRNCNPQAETWAPVCLALSRWPETKSQMK